MGNATRNISSGVNVDPDFYFASIVSGIVMMLMFVCSSVLSPIVLWALWKTERFKTSVYRMIGLILFNEVLVRIFGSPLLITSMLSVRWLYFDVGCVFYAFLMTWLGVTTTSLFTCVAIERYIIMCQPDLRHHLTVHAANITGVICYIHGLIWAIAPLLMTNGYVYEPSRLSCTPDWSHDNIGYIMGLLFVCFIMPVLTSMYCYITIYKAIRRHTIRTGFGSTVDNNVAFNTAITLGTFLFSWTPYVCIALHKTLGMEEHIILSKEITLIPLVTAKTAGLCHPLVFGLNNSDIRNVIRSELKHFCCQTFCMKRLSRRSSLGRLKSKAQYDRSNERLNHQENEVTHKNNTYQQVNKDSYEVIHSSRTSTEV